MPDLGLGLAPLGSSGFGFGEPAKLNSTSRRLFLVADGKRANAPAIDTKTGDMVRDPATGIHRGMDSVAQQVYLALRTLKGSAIVRQLGIAFKVKVLSETTEQKVKEAVQSALSALVNRRLVRVESIEAERIKVTGLRVAVRWTNLTNGETNVSRWDNG